MDKGKLKLILDQEKEKFANKTYKELSVLKDPTVYECGVGDGWYQVEVQILEKNDKYVHIAVNVDDGGFPRSFIPLSTSFLVYKDGSVDK